MIPKLAKFPLRTEFLEFRRRANKTLSPHTTCYSLPAASPRLAVIIPKKLSKLATTRNWLKRLTFDTLWPILQEETLDLIVVFKPLPLKKSLEIKQQIIIELQSIFPSL